MNDRHLYKIWDKDKKEWLAEGRPMNLLYSLKRNAFMFDNDNYDIPKNIEVVQCIGLKDKNGKLIFQGDIVKSRDGEYSIDSEIIGNIYENPELLNSKT